MFKYFFALMLLCSFCVDAATQVKCFKVHHLYVQDRINSELKNLSKNYIPVNHIQIVALDEYNLQVLITYDLLTF